MHTNRPRRYPVLPLIIGLLIATVLASCSSANPTGANSEPNTKNGGALVIGSQQYYSNEIIAELYAQALEAKGFQVTRQYQIGQREIYLPELEAGRVDVIPEYSGNLLQYYDKKSNAHTSDEIVASLKKVLPNNLRALNPATATDQDSYNVTQATADKYGLTSIADLAKLPQPVAIGGNSELTTRPYGPSGLLASYGAKATVTPIEDSGGPLTIKALVDSTVQAVDVYSASPDIASNHLVTLKDPQSLILPQNVIPIVTSKVSETQTEVINEVDAKLTPADLIAMNQQSVTNKDSSASIAKAWLHEKGLI